MTGTNKTVEKIVILLVALAARISVAVLWGDESLQHEFGTLTRNFLAGNGYAYFSVLQTGIISESFSGGAQALPSAYLPPLYPGLIFLFCGLFGMDVGIPILLGFQTLLGTYSCFLVFRISKRLFSEDTGIVAMAIAALFPVLAFLPSQISAVNLYLPLALTLIDRLFESWDKRTAKSFILPGIVAGLLVLARTQFVLIVILSAGLIFFFQAKRKFAGPAIFLIFAALVITPWILRNAIILGAPTLNTTGGLNLWMGQHVGATGSHAGYTVGDLDESDTVSAMEQRLSGISADHRYELSRDQIYRDQAIEFIIDHPTRVFSLGLKKVSFLWLWIWDRSVDYPGARSLLLVFPWLVIMLIGLTGRFVYSRNSRLVYVTDLFLWIPTAIASVFFVLPRFQILLVPILIVYSSPVFCRLINHILGTEHAAGPHDGNRQPEPGTS